MSKSSTEITQFNLKKKQLKKYSQISLKKISGAHTVLVMKRMVSNGQPPSPPLLPSRRRPAATSWRPLVRTAIWIWAMSPMWWSAGLVISSVRASAALAQSLAAAAGSKRALNALFCSVTPLHTPPIPLLLKTLLFLRKKNTKIHTHTQLYSYYIK